MSINLMILIGVGILVLWFTTHRVMQANGEADKQTSAFSSLKRLAVVLLILISLVGIPLLICLAVWFSLGFLFPDLSDEWRRELAVAAAMVGWLILFAAPLKRLSKDKKE